MDLLVLPSRHRTPFWNSTIQFSFPLASTRWKIRVGRILLSSGNLPSSTLEGPWTSRGRKETKGSRGCVASKLHWSQLRARTSPSSHAAKCASTSSSSDPGHEQRVVSDVLSGVALQSAAGDIPAVSSALASADTPTNPRPPIGSVGGEHAAATSASSAAGGAGSLPGTVASDAGTLPGTVASVGSNGS